MSKRMNRRALAIAAAALTSAAMMSASRVHAAEACTEVKVMASAGPESDVVAKYAKQDFEKATGITATIDTVARDVQAQRESAEFVGDAGEYDVVFVTGRGQIVGRTRALRRHAKIHGPNRTSRSSILPSVIWRQWMTES